MSQVTDNLPPEYEYGYVTGRVVMRVADTVRDTDRYPEARGATGTVTFSPLETRRIASDAIVLDGPTSVSLVDGYINDGQGEGVYLVTGVYAVTFNVVGGFVPSITVEVTNAHTPANPLDLRMAIPYVPVPSSPEQVVTVAMAQQVLDLYNSGQVGVTDHGALTGLGDDDHPHYLNSARGDARYYTKTAVDTALNGKVGTGDTRLTNARTPLAHTHAQADITGLASALADKVGTSDARLTNARTPLAHDHPITGVTGLRAELDAAPYMLNWTSVDQARPATSRPVFWVGNFTSPPTNALPFDHVTRTGI